MSIIFPLNTQIQRLRLVLIVSFILGLCSSALSQRASQGNARKSAEKVQGPKGPRTSPAPSVGRVDEKEAQAYAESGSYEEAIEIYERLLALYRKKGNREGEGHTLRELTWAYYTLGRYHKVIEYGNQAVVIARELKDRAGEALTLSLLGTAFYGLGSYDKAVEVQEQAYVLIRETNNSVGEASS